MAGNQSKENWTVVISFAATELLYKMSMEEARLGTANSQSSRR